MYAPDFARWVLTLSTDSHRVVSPDKPSTLPNMPSHHTPSLTPNVTEVQIYQRVLSVQRSSSIGHATTEMPSRLILSQDLFTRTDQEQPR